MSATRGPGIARRADVAAVIGGLATVTAIAWSLTVRLASGMEMPAASMPMASSSSMPAPAGGLLLATAMWSAMMVGMMVPSATPMVVAYTGWTRRGPVAPNRPTAIASFLAGYVVVWLGFSVAASILQVGLERLGVLSVMGATTAPVVGGAVLVAAGAFQLTRWKEACLGRCRTPVGFLIEQWRDGAWGGLVMGLRHGAYCLGCCWALMAVLFVVGTMHLAWMAVLAVFVLAEKVAPPVLPIRHVSAAALVGWGTWMLATAGG
ncbi:MAG: DUF2182 domain-containing protein [Actinobacteria bacterium]|nr:DUF2182 domain-containing protein [Actinomycetota bacterium]